MAEAADVAKSNADQLREIGVQSDFERYVAVDVVQIVTSGQSLPHSGFTGF